MVGSPLRFTWRSTEQCSGRSSRSGPVARNATFIASPMGSAWIAANVSGGSGGSKVMAPAPSTPVETVTIAEFAVMVPRAVSTATPAPLQATRETGVASLMSRPSPSRRAMKAPMPPCGTRLLPDSRLPSQSRRLKSSAAAQQMIGPSQVSTVTAQGSSCIDRATSASGASPRVRRISAPRFSKRSQAPA